MPHNSSSLAISSNRIQVFPLSYVISRWRRIFFVETPRNSIQNFKNVQLTSCFHPSYVIRGRKGIPRSSYISHCTSLAIRLQPTSQRVCTWCKSFILFNKQPCVSNLLNAIKWVFLRFLLFFSSSNQHSTYFLTLSMSEQLMSAFFYTFKHCKTLTSSIPID